jgi:hypothetical protein
LIIFLFKTYMDKSLIIRSLITSILNQDNNILFKTNLYFFYDLEDSILRDDQINTYLKKKILKMDRNLIYNIFLNTYTGEQDILFFQNFNLKLENYIQCDHTIADIENTIFPVHSIFYRFFIKGGAALKVFVDNLETLGIIGHDIPYIPNIAIDPTDIDSNIIVNPIFPEAIELITLFKQIIKDISLKMFEKYNTIYYKFCEQLINKIERNDDFLKKISRLFNKQHIFITIPAKEESNTILPNNGFSIKPENSCLRFTNLNSPICIFRLLLCVDIHETNVETHQFENAEMGIPKSLFITHGEAEIIDITLYEMTNPKYNDIWEWAKHALPYDRRHTLFQGIHQMIIDIIQMNTDAEVTQNPSLLSKIEKRKSRLNYLYYLYCNYRLIQLILEHKNEINEKHIIQYCHPLVEEPFLQLGLTSNQINEILPYIIGKNPVAIHQIIIDFIKNYILVDQSFQYELSNKSGLLLSSKLDKSIYQFIFPDIAMKKIEDYIKKSVLTVSKRSSTLVLLYLIEGYKATYIDGNTLFIFICAILDTVDLPFGNFPATVRTTYNSMVKSLKLAHQQLIQSNQYFQMMRKNNIPINFANVILQENIGKLCKELVDQSQIWLDVTILNKYAPFKILCTPHSDINILQLLEIIFEIVNAYLSKLNAPYLILYELTPEYVINIYYRFLFKKTIQKINLQGDVDIHFCRFIIKYQNMPRNVVLLYENQGNALYQNF